MDATINGKTLDEVSKSEVLKFCHEHKTQYIREVDDIDEGLREFDCLIEGIENDSIPAADLPDYGISDQDLGVTFNGETGG